MILTPATATTATTPPPTTTITTTITSPFVPTAKVDPTEPR